MGATSPLPKRPGLRRPIKVRAASDGGQDGGLLLAVLAQRGGSFRAVSAPASKAWSRHSGALDRPGVAAMIRVKLLRLTQAALASEIGMTSRQVMTMERGTMPGGRQISEERWRRYGIALMARVIGVGGTFGDFTYEPPGHLLFDIVQASDGQALVSAYPADDPSARISFTIGRVRLKPSPSR